MKKLKMWYLNYVGISLKLARVHCNGISYNKGHYCILSMHPLKSITWIWAIYFDIDRPFFKRFYILKQKAIWRFEKRNIMKLEKKVKQQLLNRGFTKEQLLNNRGFIGAVIDETELAVVKNLTIPDVSVSLPNEIDLGALANLLKYSDRYEISIQFWPDLIAVYISKDDVDLKDFGGDFEFAVSNSIAYLNKITGNEC